MTDPTPKQQEVWDYIHGFITDYGYPPTVREIGDAFGMQVNGVMCHLKALRRKGKISWTEHQARTLVLTGYRVELVEL